MMKDQKKPIEIYVHIPFCVRKCSYCDFLSGAYDKSIRSEYIKSLTDEIKQECMYIKKSSGDDAGYEVTGIYFGGGTPSTLDASELSGLLETIYESTDIAKDCEITVEVNPGTADLCKLKSIKKAGFNRISIGLQSADEEELKTLGRIHTWNDFYKCYVNSRAAGFNNINVDIMTALPGQDTDKLDATLDKVIELSPEHISAYSLMIEEGTKFYEIYGETDGPVVGQDIERKLYWHTVDRLKEAGYEHYEISNFAKHGRRSRHNCGYWTGTYYLGLGLGASSFLPTEPVQGIIQQHTSAITGTDKNIRIVNCRNLRTFIADPLKKEEIIINERKDMMEEFMFLGLRMMEGISISDFTKRFGADIWKVYGKTIRELMVKQLVAQEGDRIFLTRLGIDYGNYTFAQFLDPPL